MASTAVLTSPRPRAAFQARAFVSLFLVTSLVFFVLSGLVLYLAPSGRVAESSAWRLLWLDKAQWEAMHTSVSLAWVPVALLHVLYNWRAVLSHLRSRSRQVARRRYEFGLATLLTLLLAAASVGNWAPVKQLMALGNSMDGFWTARANASGYYVPVGGEELPAGGETQTAAVTPAAPEDAASEVRKGFGRFTVQELAERYELSLEAARSRLGAQGVRDVRAEETLLEVSGRSGYSPSDLDAIVQGKPLPSTAEAK